MSKSVAARIAIALLTVSAGGLAFIGTEEGSGPTAVIDGEKKAVAYADPALGWSVPTICKGHTRGVFRGMAVSLEQCEDWLREDTSASGVAIRRCTHADMTQRQYDMVVSFVHNVGGGAYCGSSLVRKLNAGNCRGAAVEFNAAPQIDRVTGFPRVWNGKPIIGRGGKVLLPTGGQIMKWTTAGGKPLANLIERRGRERAIFEEDCAAWEQVKGG